MRPCTIVGNVGKTPELRYTPAGAAVTNFSLALYGGRTNQDDPQPITTWVRVACWKDLAVVVADRVGKGDKIICEGYLLPIRTYINKEEQEGHSLEFTAFSVKALQWSPQDLTELPPTPTPEDTAKEPEDLPFD